MPVLLAPEQAPALSELLTALGPHAPAYRIWGADAGNRAIRGLSGLHNAGPEEISFLSNARLGSLLSTSQAAAVIMTPEARAELVPDHAPYGVVTCEEPYLMYALLAQWFDRHRLQSLPAGVHASAIIHESATLEPGVAIGPYCVLEEGVHIGRGTRLGAGVSVGKDSRVGRDSLLHARVTLYHGVQLGDRAIVHSGAVLGADGFGFAPAPGGGWSKIAQLGGVLAGDDVEIGANTTVDRGALDATVIGNGVKLDNQIMVAHNVHIGDHTAIAACVGIAGSTRIGRRCTIGGAAMISGHLVLADDVHVSGGTAITSSVNRPGRYTGVYPYAPHSEWQHNAAVISRLAQLRRQVRAYAHPPPKGGNS